MSQRGLDDPGDQARAKAAAADETGGATPPSAGKCVITDQAIRLAIERALLALPVESRMAFTLSRVHGLSHAQIAERLEIPVEQVATCIAEVLKACAIALVDRFG